MPFRVSGKNIDVGEALRGRISGRIAEAMGKYFDGGYSGHVTVAREGFASEIALQGSEAKLRGRISREHELIQPIAEAADAIVEDDRPSGRRRIHCRGWRRLAWMRTAISSGRGLTKSSRMRPSSV